MNLQDSFLNQARRENLKLSVRLVSGGRLEGRVTGFDNFTIVLDDGKGKHLIYKHAIALVSPLGQEKERPTPQREEKERPTPQREEKERKTAKKKVFNESLQRELESRETKT